MKEKSFFSLIITNIAMVVVILVGFVWTVYQDSTSYYQLVQDQLVSVVRLASANVHSEIDDDLTRPFMVSRTMANDAFLVEWASQENPQGATEAQLKRLTAYLNEYHREYQYNTVFFVSDKSQHYYHQEGVHKILSREDSHDQWYYSFRDSGATASMELDTNESEGNSLTFFLNYNVKDAGGNPIGVIGVGYQVSDLITRMERFEETYGLHIYLVGNDATVKANPDVNTNFITERAFYSEINPNTSFRLSKDDDFTLYWDASLYDNGCIVVKYMDNLDWYLVIEKDMESLRAMFLHNIQKNVGSMALVVLLCIACTTGIFLWYHKKLVKRENTDALTCLMNRRHFESAAKGFLKKTAVKTLFLFDLDHFKMVNDMRGHIFGNEVLALVGRTLQEKTKDMGIVARWGGDEFCGLLAVGPEKAKALLQSFAETIAAEEKRLGCLITISCGIVSADRKVSLDTLFEMADKALYRSKANGRNQVTEYKDDAR